MRLITGTDCRDSSSKKHPERQAHEPGLEVVPNCLATIGALVAPDLQS